MLAEAVTPATQAITFAVIGALVTIVTLYLTNRAKRQAEERANKQHLAREEVRLREKGEDLAAQIAKEQRDNDRQDELEARHAILEAKTLRKLTDVEDLGIVTHALVNADKTAGMKATLILMLEVVDLKRSLGKEPTKESLDAIDELREAIKLRMADQRAAEERIKVDKNIVAADKQIEAAGAQQVAADSQIVAANHIAEALATTSTPFPPPPPGGQA